MFFGYEFEPGCVWKGVYRVAPLDQFRGKTVGEGFRPNLLSVKEVTFDPTAVVIFPLREARDLIENSIIADAPAETDADSESRAESDEIEGELLADTDDSVIDASQGSSQLRACEFDMR